MLAGEGMTKAERPGRSPQGRSTVLGITLAALVTLVGLTGCVAAPGATGRGTAGATWPVSPEPLPSATSGAPDATLTCGGRTFPASGLEAPTGVERGSGPESGALRATLAKFALEFPGSSAWTWRLAGRDETGAVFLARTDAFGPPGWVYVEVASGADGLEPQSMGGCDPHVVLSAEFGPATWALDPAFPAPGPDATELHVLVWERACSGGSPATRRMSAPVIDYGTTSVTITIGVRPLGGIQTCPLPPGTPAIVPLSEPLGTRSLLDGDRVPPAPPAAPGG